LCFAKKGGCNSKWKDGAKEIEDQNTDRMENPDPADQYNTVLKMAKKRAQVDATLTAVGASDLLTQDLEDLPSGSPPPVESYEDAEFTERAANEPAAAGALAAIDMAETVADLKTLVPQLTKLTGEAKVEGRRRYSDRLKELTAAAQDEAVP
jgi:hypothetical protein